MLGPNKDCVVSLLTKKNVAHNILVFINTRCDALQTGIDALKHRLKSITEKEVKSQMESTIKNMEENLCDFITVRDTFQKAVSK